ncbi:MAG: hypothetical protein EZS28_011094 [Streblomastix strix]|uniref:Uncharacterized protein n=1 Tax=Streblomastix strix TaxID=222440 RepID=A0A5J4WEU1_9EUKA|nr:MAG: hypothetical protein EZS28_011094 [Streblomastix strix]
MKSPIILEVEPQFEKEIEVNAQPFQQQVIRCETPQLSAKRKSSIFKETLTPDPSVCCRLLDIISEDEHMVKESTCFVLSENQLVLVVAYTFDVHESQVQLIVEDEGCCGWFYSDSIQTLIEILIGNVNVLKLDVEKVNLLGDSYKIYDDALLLLKADKTELIDAYNKTEVDTLLDNKLNITDQIDAYSKAEDDALLLLKADKTDIIDAYTKIETDEKFDLKAKVADIVDGYSKTEENELLLLKTNKSEFIDSYSKIEIDTKLDEKVDKTELDDYVDLTSAQTISGTKQFNSKVNAASFEKTGKMMLLFFLLVVEIYQ